MHFGIESKSSKNDGFFKNVNGYYIVSPKIILGKSITSLFTAFECQQTGTSVQADMYKFIKKHNKNNEQIHVEYTLIKNNKFSKVRRKVLNCDP